MTPNSEQFDVILITGDIYIDHPLCGIAIIARILEKFNLSSQVIALPSPIQGIALPAPILLTIQSQKTILKKTKDLNKLLALR